MSLFTLLAGFLAASNAQWTLQSSGPWEGGEGLMGIASEDGNLYLSGGRGGLGKQFFFQFYRSQDLGKTWTSVVDPTPWEGRAYHVHLEKDGCQYIMGGQNWTDFYNDVWQTCDGGNTWNELVKAAPWTPRAGLSAVVLDDTLYMCAGSLMPDFQNRDFYNDCWVSTDGINWKQTTAAAPWAPRSGPRLVAYQSNIYIVGGEDGFSVDTQYNDVWMSTDGTATWTQVTAAAAWSPRSGHSVVTYQNSMYVIAGYLDLHDLWVSQDGATWSLVSNSTWNCNDDSCGRYDFWAVVQNSTLVTFGGTSAASTFGLMYDTTYTYDLA
jgi:photosystem II stability/assembly factor-like uncharacterized protein